MHLKRIFFTYIGSLKIKHIGSSIMKKILTLLLFALVFTACKKHKNTFTLDEKDAARTKTVLSILNEHARNAQNFTTTTIRSSASYKTSNTSQNFSLDIQIERDEQMLLDIRFLGFPVAKVYLTPQEVKYYDRINKTYFSGDYSILSQWIGMDLDFNRFQNLLLGQVIDSQPISKTEKSIIEQGLHKIESSIQENVLNNYYFEDQNSLLKKEEIIESLNKRSVVIDYPAYQQIGKYLVPTEINIVAEQEKVINLRLIYDRVIFDEPINFHYKVPNGYKQITIN